MSTGENEQGLRMINDFIRLFSVAILVVHFYDVCHYSLQHWGITADITDKIVLILQRFSIFNNVYAAKCSSLLLLSLTIIAVKGKKDQKIGYRESICYVVVGLLIFFGTNTLLFTSGNLHQLATLYIALTSAGYLLIAVGGAYLSRIIKTKLKDDIFNSLEESFPQEERKLENEYSINLPAQYRLNGKLRKSWINIINPFRALLIVGTPGAGKSYFVIRHIIDQHIRKGFSALIYDYKFPDLSTIAYNKLLQYQKNYKVPPQFCVINFDDLERSHRCNPLDPTRLEDITDATESARAILLGLNREWQKKIGDFWVESPINFVTALIWYLRLHENGRYCTLPHVLELMQQPYEELFSILSTEPTISPFINAFINALKNGAAEQLEGQIASAKVGIARLSSPYLYWVLSGNDFSLDINDPEHPKILCVGNNPQKIQIYGAVLSLYVARILKLVNRKGKLKCSLLFDEFPTIYVGGGGIEGAIATARSNKCAISLAVQSTEQLKKDYGREAADVIVGITGSIIAGQATGEIAKQLSERIGKIKQKKESLSINRNDTSLSISSQMEPAVPPNKIAALSSGEFCGVVTDDPTQKIELKAFHCEIINDHAAIAKEDASFEEIPVIRKVTADDVQKNYMQIKADVDNIVSSEILRIKTNPELQKYLITRDED